MLSRLILPNLRTRLVAVIFVALLPAFVLLVTIASMERTRAEESARLESMAMAQLLRGQYEEILTSTQQSLAWLADFPEVTGADSAACTARLVKFSETANTYLGLSVSSRDGNVRCIASSDWALTGSRTISDQLFFQRALATKRFTVGDVQNASASGKPILTAGYPVLDTDGNVKTVIGAGLDIELLGQRLAANPLYQFASLTLFDRNGTVVMRRPDDGGRFVGQNFADTALFAALRSGHADWTRTTGLSGDERIFAYTPIGAPGAPDLYAVAGFSTDYVFAGVNRMLQLSLGGLAVIGLAALASAWISAEFMIVRRTQRVVDAALRMRAGDFSARVGMANDNSEMGQLAQTFDSMAATLQERDEENARLFAQMQQLNAELESRVIKRTEQLQISNVKLLETQADLRRLSEQLMLSIEQERARISREIHDQLGQLLTAVKMELKAIERAWKRDPHQVNEQLAETVGLVDETIKTVRRIATDLRPGILDDFGLAAAIEWQLQQFRDRTGIVVDLNSRIEEERLSKDMATAVFRILQEALTNVARHAEASRVDVTVRSAEDNFELVVQDNGKGLNIEPGRKSLGLLGMRERARQFGGSVTIAGAAGQGVSVQLKVPLREYNVELPPTQH